MAATLDSNTTEKRSIHILQGVVTSFALGEDDLTSEILVCLAKSKDTASRLRISEQAYARLGIYRQFVEGALDSGRTIYGINTGFGYLSHVQIPHEDLAKLQLNLIRSHACGVGAPVEPAVVRGLLILRLHTFLLGHSGVSRGCVDGLMGLLRADVLPIVPEKGSVGASGDLAPLSHLALGLMGEGEVLCDGVRMPAKEALRIKGLTPFVPGPKEGLSLINGTQFMSVLGAFAVEEAKTLAESADMVAALSLDAVQGTPTAFHEGIQNVRKQKGQAQVAANLRRIFTEVDPIRESHRDCAKVQDPYSFRCIPQVHGASRDAIGYVEDVLNRELNSVTDNPVVFETGEVVSGGNFHGQPLAIALDFLAIAVAELGSISQCRTEKMINPSLSSLPAFLAKDSGLNSGYMIPQVVAAALVSENKVLCHPASVDTIPTSADKEDHVSMGPIACRKAREINENVATVLAIELLAACQGIDLLAPLKPGPTLHKIYSAVRGMSPFMAQDRSLSEDFYHLAEWIKAGGICHLT